MDVAAVLSGAMIGAGTSKSALSRASGVSRSSIDDYLFGRREPGISQLERLLEALGQSLTVGVRPVGWDEFLAVLDFGTLFPTREPSPLQDMTAVWQGRRDPATSA